jgi:hypothetical protein
VIVADESAVEQAPVVQQLSLNRVASLESMRKNAFVQQVTSIFGGTLVDVRPVAPTGSHES